MSLGCPFSLAATGIIPPEDARALRQMGIARVYTPKDFKITEIMGDVVGIVEKAWLVEG
jgi:(2R)-ethylmalonyl-CoA mutase